MEKLKKSIKGITIISLVITIIVLLILSGVSINLSLGQEGIFKKAKNATEKYANASNNEIKEINNFSNTIENYINDYMNENEEDKPIKVESTLDLVNGEEKTNTEVNDSLGNKVVVPAGFKIINPEKNVTDGIIIQDVQAGDDISKGNEYVWVPVGKININENGESVNIELGRYTFDTDGKETLHQTSSEYEKEVIIQEYYVETIEDKFGNAVPENLGKFVISVEKYGGFYIGRYEVGANEASEKRVFQVDTSHMDSTPVVKSNKWPYTFVNQKDASILSRQMYDNNKENYSSDLINSYDWDTTISFIQKCSDNKTYSQSGSLQTILTTTGNSKDANNNKDVVCNIYDLAGNSYEYSTEISLYDTNNIIVRGGGYTGNSPSTSRFSRGVTTSVEVRSFRTIIYLEV